MIEIENLFIEDVKAYEICRKHINDCILAGVEYYIDTYDISDGVSEDLSKELSEEFEKSKEFLDLFPRGFSGSRLNTLKKIRNLIQSEELVELKPAYKYTLMHCLEDYYNDNTLEYTLEKAADIIVNTEYKFDKNIFPIKNIEDRFYVMSKMAFEVHSIVNDISVMDSDKEDNYFNTLEETMGSIEDIRQYAELCFEDMDYEMLGKYTRKELIDSGIQETLGLDI